jgi:hypothetical protein
MDVKLCLHNKRIHVQDATLRRIFGLKKEELTGGWRKLHREHLHKFFSSPNIITMSCGECGTLGKFIAEKPEEKKSP